ncbi:MAG: hypothetical protein D3917_16055 [Candidatus Electrothrix sp. AX5]|jgi:hypothetical protein|nr:hypothetical protein [Candidatus Electrothrix sp. AX5]
MRNTRRTRVKKTWMGIPLRYLTGKYFFSGSEKNTLKNIRVMRAGVRSIEFETVLNISLK